MCDRDVDLYTRPVFNISFFLSQTIHLTMT